MECICRKLASKNVSIDFRIPPHWKSSTKGICKKYVCQSTSSRTCYKKRKNITFPPFPWSHRLGSGARRPTKKHQLPSEINEIFLSQNSTSSISSSSSTSSAEMLYASHRSKPGSFLTNGSYGSNISEERPIHSDFWSICFTNSMGVFQSSFLGIWNWTALASNCLLAMMICPFSPRQSDDKDLRTSEFHRSFRFLSPPLLAGASPVPPRVTRPVLTGHLDSQSNPSSKKTKWSKQLKSQVQC